MIAQSTMDIAHATPLLGGLSPQVFMRRHWQKKPLVVRQAVPGGVVLAQRSELFALAARDDVESRLVTCVGGRWALRHGPISRRALPPLGQRGWTLLVQGLDLHVAPARALLNRFRFVPDARLDDLMLSYASDGGGVGPHVDSYDVFLLQAQGRRLWRVARPRRDAGFVADAPLKILADWTPEQEWLLDAGDMLYLPPGWGHEGVAQGECTTASIGFRAPAAGALGRDVLQRVVEAAEPAAADGRLYRDPNEAATPEPGRIPPALQAFASAAVARLLADPDAASCALGEWLSEPKPQVWFDAAAPATAANATQAPPERCGVLLDRRTRMLYDDRRIFINGESHRVGGRDRRLMRRLADRRCLEAAETERLSAAARESLAEWLGAGWLHVAPAASRE